MARERKLEAPVTLFAAIEAEQHEALRTIAFQQHRSLADVVRQAIDEFIENQPKPRLKSSRLAVEAEKLAAART